MDDNDLIPAAALIFVIAMLVFIAGGISFSNYVNRDAPFTPYSCDILPDTGMFFPNGRSEPGILMTNEQYNVYCGADANDNQ